MLRSIFQILLRKGISLLWSKFKADLIKTNGNKDIATAAELKLRLALKSTKNLDQELLRPRPTDGSGAIGLALAVVNAAKKLKLANEEIARLSETNPELALEYKKLINKMLEKFKFRLRRAKKLLRERQALKLEADRLKQAELASNAYALWKNFMGGMQEQKLLFSAVANNIGTGLWTAAAPSAAAPVVAPSVAASVVAPAAKRIVVAAPGF